MNASSVFQARHGVLYSGRRFQHHQEGSGYDFIVPADGVHVSANSFVYRGLRNSGLMLKVGCWLADLFTVYLGLFSKSVHYYYPEDTAFFSPIVLSLLGRKIVYTVHLDDEVWRDGRGMGRTFFLKQMSFRFASTVVCLSTAQTTSLKKAFPRKAVVFAPHGLPVSDNAQIEVDFDLVKRRRQLNRIIVVGDNYRDLDMLSRIVSARGERSVSIHLLGFSKQAKSRFLNLPGVVVVERLSAADFNEYIVESFTLLLPLTFATANNALLEAHVAGIPSICSRIDGVSDYATSDTKLFTEDGQYWAEFDALWSLGDGEYAAKCAAIRREAVDKFSWEKVRSMLKSVY